MAATEAAARRATVPLAIHLDHGASLDSAIKAINLGCNGVMVDTSAYPLAENIVRTREVVAMAHACGVPVEGELGYVAGVEGEDAERHPGEIRYTSPEEARAYVEQTGVDCLAVSIGTVHGRMRGELELDFSRLEQINHAAAIPLVIHGGTGLSDEQFQRLISHGVSKINYYTALADAAAARVTSNLQRGGRGYTALLQDVRAAIHAEVKRCMRLWGSAGRAYEVLTTACPWRPVEHVIIYNVSGIDEAGVDRMMAHGREVLGRIPGVRRVFTGTAMQQQASYRFSWLVQFSHEKVIDSYREHPEHERFADEWFRPVAADRISIDFAAS